MAGQTRPQILFSMRNSLFLGFIVSQLVFGMYPFCNMVYSEGNDKISTVFNKKAFSIQFSMMRKVLQRLRDYSECPDLSQEVVL